MFKRIQAYFYNQALQAAVKKIGKIERTKLPNNQIKTIGILFNASEEFNFTAVDHFAAKYSAYQVELLGYINRSKKKLGAKSIPFSCFLQDDVNWYNVPSGMKVEQFTAKKFDILIHLTITEDPVIEYIMATTKARFRVGFFQPNKEALYDLMITSKEGDKLQDLCNQIEHYLQLINP